MRGSSVCPFASAIQSVIISDKTLTHTSIFLYCRVRAIVILLASAKMESITTF